MSVSPIHLLRQPDFLRIWVCGALAGVLRWLEVLVVGVYTLAETDSPFMVALMLFMRTVPMLLLGSVIGALADRIDRRLMMVVGMLVAASSSAILVYLSWMGWLSLWHVAAGSLINGMVWTMEHPVRRALLNDVVGTEATPTAISLDAMTFNGTRVVGPLLGGLAYGTAGLIGAYVIGVVAYLFAALLIATMSSVRAKPVQTHRDSFWSSLRLGLRYVSSRDALLAVMLVTVMTNIFGFSYVSMVPVIGERVLGLDAPGLGQLMSMEGFGAITGAIVLAFLNRPSVYGRVFSLGAMLFLCMILVLSQTQSISVAMLALFVAGFGLAGFGVMQSTILLSCTVSELRSRVMGVLSVSIGMAPFGVLAMGWLAEHYGAPFALSVMSSCGLGLTVLCCVKFPLLLRVFRVQTD